jgi:hypothetical protein
LLEYALGVIGDSVGSFEVVHFGFDGELLGSSRLAVSDLSAKWLGVCVAMLEQCGPVFSQSMGGTLSHFSIKCTAGLCEFSVRDHVALAGVLLPLSPESQNRQLLQLFASEIDKVTTSPSVEPWAAAATRNLSARPLFIVVNWLNTNVNEREAEAIFQLAYHFGAAYFHWHHATQ